MTQTATNIITEIAANSLDLETLETRNCDELDFHDMAVWSIKAALEAAYAAGQANGMLKHAATSKCDCP